MGTLGVLMVCLTSATLSGVTVYLLMKHRETLATGSGKLYKEAWDQLLKDRTTAADFTAKASADMLGMAAGVVNSLSVALDQQSSRLAKQDQE